MTTATDTPPPPRDLLTGLAPAPVDEGATPDRAVVGAVVAAAVAADLAVRSGIDAVGGTLLVAVTAGGLAASRRLTNRRAWPLLALVPWFGVGLMARAAEWLVALDLAAAAGLLLLAASYARAGDPTDVSVPNLVGRALHGAGHGALAPGFLLRGAGRAADGPTRRSSLAIVRGLLLGAPVLLAVGLLLGSADPVFASFFHFPADLGDVVGHLALLTVGAWGAAGLLRLASVAPYGATLTGTRPLGRVEARTVLGALVAVFVAFTASQVVTVLGGADYVRRTSGLSYAEYARSGFFQLLAVAAITLGTILVLRAAVRDPDDAAFTWLGISAVVLTLVLVAGALRRLGLYDEAYGMTRLRLLAVLFALWLGGVFVLLGFSLAGVHRQRAWFVPGAIGLGLAGLLVLDVANPEAWIARRNVDRFGGTDRFDAAMLGDLSDDAVPALVDALDELPAVDAEELRGQLCAPPPRSDDGLFAVNLAREEADDARAAACGARLSA